MESSWITKGQPKASPGLIRAPGVTPPGPYQPVPLVRRWLVLSGEGRTRTASGGRPTAGGTGTVICAYATEHCGDLGRPAGGAGGSCPAFEQLASRSELKMIPAPWYIETITSFTKFLKFPKLKQNHTKGGALKKRPRLFRWGVRSAPTTGASPAARCLCRTAPAWATVASSVL